MVALDSLVPEDSLQIPTILEKCLKYIEDHGERARTHNYTYMITHAHTYTHTHAHTRTAV